MVSRLGFLVLVGLMIWLAWSAMRPAAKAGAERAARKIRPPRPKRTGTHEWEPKTRQVARKVKGVIPGAGTDREAILAFLDSRTGVEAFMEPKTQMHPLSVVLVAVDGEWKRFALPDDSYVRELARTRDLPVFDATRVGYPERMRKFNRERRKRNPDT